jgi:hypothetical protein
VREQEFERRHAVVGKSADDLAVVIPVWREAIGFDHRPIGQILEKQIRRILDAVFFLVAGAAAQRQVAARRDGVTADMRLRLDNDDRSAASRATMAAGKPVAPEPMTTISASRSQTISRSTGHALP